MLARLLRDRRGVAAVELALIAPAIAGLTFITFEAWRYATHIQEMNDALKAGVRYYMAEGKNDTAAKEIALASWTNAPANAAVSVARACVCGTTAHVCTTLCSNLTVPEVRVTLHATATYAQSYFTPNVQTTQVVRVR